jgi:hypothetical protein
VNRARERNGLLAGSRIAIISASPTGLSDGYVLRSRFTVTQAKREYTRNWSTPSSWGLWGGSPGERAKLAWTIAHRIDPNPYWLQIESASESRDSEEYSIVGQLAPENLFLLDPSELAPPAEQGNVATWFLRKDVAAGDRLNRLADFARLPLLAQRLLKGRSAYSPAKALVMAHSDRIQDMYPTEEGGIRPFIEAMNEFATTPIFTVTGPPVPNARDLDYVFQLTDIDRGGQKLTRAICEIGAPINVVGLFTVRAERDFDVLLDEIRGAPP